MLNALTINPFIKERGAEEMDSNNAVVDVVRKLVKVDRLHHSCVDARIDALGLSIHRNQHITLMFIAKKGMVASQKEIAENFGISAAAVANTLKALEKGGYIERKSDDDDTRRNLVSVTEKGMEIIELSRREFRRVDDAASKGLTAEEIKALNSALDKITANLSGFASENISKEKYRQK